MVNLQWHLWGATVMHHRHLLCRRQTLWLEFKDFPHPLDWKPAILRGTWRNPEVAWYVIPCHIAKKQCLSYTWKRIRGNQNDARFSWDLQTGIKSMGGGTLKVTAKEDKMGLPENWFLMQWNASTQRQCRGVTCCCTLPLFAQTNSV